MCLEIRTETLFKNQTKVYETINNYESYFTSFLFNFSLNEYDRISAYHGSGKDFLGTKHYDEFMETKWCMVDDQVSELINSIVKESMNKKYKTNRPVGW